MADSLVQNLSHQPDPFQTQDTLETFTHEILLWNDHFSDYSMIPLLCKYYSLSCMLSSLCSAKLFPN